MTHRVANRRRPAWMNRVLEFVKPRKVMFAMMAGAGLGMASVNITIVRPLLRQFDAVRQDMTELSGRMNRLAAIRGSIYEANDLLAALEAQKQTTQGARGSLAAIRQFRAEVEQESRHTAAAVAAFDGLAALQARVEAAGSRNAALQASLNDLELLQDRTVLLGAAAAERIAAIQQADEALARLQALQNRVLEDASRLDAAHAALDSSQKLHESLEEAAPALKDAKQHLSSMTELVARLRGVAAGELEESARHAAELLTLHDMLADGESMQFGDANRNLRMMLDTQSQLARSTQGMVAAAESLDLLTEFQRQVSLELGSIGQLRHQLTEIAFLRNAVQQVSEMMQPLTELSTLKRLNDDEIRSIARQILDRRVAHSDAPPSVESIFDAPEATAEGPVEKLVPAPIHE